MTYSHSYAPLQAGGGDDQAAKYDEGDTGARKAEQFSAHYGGGHAVSSPFETFYNAAAPAPVGGGGSKKDNNTMIISVSVATGAMLFIILGMLFVVPARKR